MSTTARLLALIATVFLFVSPIGCGGCDETGGTTIDPDLGVSTDTGDVHTPDTQDLDVDPDTGNHRPDTDPGQGEECDEEGVRRPCGTNVGECLEGSQYCVDGAWTECIGGVRPQPESCNGRDDSCSGTADDGDEMCPESVCRGAGQCLDGECVYDPSTALDCSAYDTQCQVGHCIEKELGECIQIPREDGTPCDDGIFCNAETTCSFGECTNIVSTRDCAELIDDCHIGQCSLELNRCERVQVDLACLTATITAGPEARIWSTEAIFEFECSDPPCQFECRIDTGAWAPCTSPEEHTGFGLGEHTFFVRARKDGGTWSDPDRRTWEVYLPTCADAALGRLYIGCEYWPVALANDLLAETFRNHYAVVVTNPLPGTVAQVSVYAAGSAVPVAQAQVPGNELRVMRLPWNALASMGTGPGNTVVSRTQQGSIAYRLESDTPVNAYQFNPLLSFAPLPCAGNGDCPGPERCTPAGTCAVSTTNSFTNDASLLLPAHIFGLNSQYIVPSLPHMDRGGIPYPSYIAIVATQNNTQVRIRNRGYTAVGPTLAAMNPGADQTVTLNRHDVLQIATRPAGAFVQANVVPTPSAGTTAREYPETDLTGSIVSANRPIALYSGATCRQIPFNYQACDHVEQQVFPLETLGHAYVGAVSALAPGVNPATTPVKGDVWRLVAVQNNTQITLTPASVHEPVTLNAGEWIEFLSDEHFYVSSQGPAFPIMLSQYLVSQGAHGGTQGDPSMILPAPVGQYRQQSIFTTPQEIASHYVNIVRTAGTSVSLDGSPPPANCWQAIPDTTYQVCRMPISEGVHTVSAASGVGLTVYGYDNSVSYGYTGGLGLLPTTAINPDW